MWKLLCRELGAQRFNRNVRSRKQALQVRYWHGYDKAPSRDTPIEAAGLNSAAIGALSKQITAACDKTLNCAVQTLESSVVCVNCSITSPRSLRLKQSRVGEGPWCQQEAKIQDVWQGCLQSCFRD